MKVFPTPFLGAPSLGVQPAQVTNNKTNTSDGVQCGNNGTHIVIILDESSSMSSCYDQTISGFNEYISHQRDKVDVDKAIVTVVKFNGGNVKTLWSAVDIKDIPDLTDHYQPSGMTNLLDAIGTTIENVDKTLSQKPQEERPCIFFVIFTDGQENQSKEFTKPGLLAQMVKNREAKEWVFTFLGANIDAFSAGQVFGMQASNTIQYSTSNMADTFTVLAESTGAVRSAKAANISTAEIYAQGLYSSDARDKTMGGKK